MKICVTATSGDLNAQVGHRFGSILRDRRLRHDLKRYPMKALVQQVELEFRRHRR